MAKDSPSTTQQPSLIGLDSASLPVVAIIGRPNVGKSTLFNRILGTRNAIVDDTPGVTRDRLFAECVYQRYRFHIIDTGGLDLSAQEGMVGLIRQQSQLAIEEADILLVIMDGRAGLTPLDMEIVNLLRSITKPIFFAINKLDSSKSDALLADFYQLGQNTLYPISAEQGIGVDELLEAFLPLIPQDTSDDILEEAPKIALVGRPNVGKSTLLNTILGEERVVVSDIPGTTRDPVDSQVTYKGKPYLFTDTAGIRRRGKIDRGIEGYSVARTLRALGRSDLGVFLLDGVEGVTEQDAKIAGLLIRQGRGCVLLINKWDLRKHETEAQHGYLEELNRRFPFFSFVPTLFGSALQSDSLSHLFKKIDQVMKAFSTRVPTAQLNQFLQQALIANPLATRRGNSSRSVFMTQVATKPPTIALFVGKSVEVKPAYLRYLENQLRLAFGFEGTPLRVLVRKK